MGAYTGRTMAPITTADFVGLDIHKAIVDNIYANTNDFSHKSFICPGYINKLVEKGMFGRKSGGGLYYLKKFDSGVKQMYVYDIASDSYREANKYVFPFAETMIRKLRKGSYKSAFQALIDNHSQEAEMCLHFLLKYVIYSIAASEEVGFSVHEDVYKRQIRKNGAMFECENGHQGSRFLNSARNLGVKCLKDFERKRK